ncbi:hypothetical protein BDV06DRAFT_205497 [Aspergillus oleicola]
MQHRQSRSLGRMDSSPASVSSCISCSCVFLQVRQGLLLCCMLPRWSHSRAQR